MTLPEVDSKEFDGGENETYTLKRVSCLPDKHTWRQMSGREIECTQCHVGYILPVGGELKDNHVFIHGTQVI